jgi:hypothetical protein
MISPELSQYRASGKGLNTGPGAIVLVGPSFLCCGFNSIGFALQEWLRSTPWIDKQYFEGEVGKELRKKIKATFRYARNEVKAVVRVSSS